MIVRKEWVRPAVGFLVAAVFFFLAFGRMQWRSIESVAASAAIGPLVLALVALTAAYFIRIVRWWWMLRALEPGLALRSCVRPYLLSIAANNTMPLRAGDLLRAFGFRDALRSSPVRVIGTLLIERLLDLFVLLAIFFAGVLGVAAGAIPPRFLTAGIVLGVASLVGLLVLVLAPEALHRVLQAILRAGPLARQRWIGRVSGVVEQLFGTLSLVQSPRRVLELLGLSLLSWGLEGAVYASVAWSLHAGGSLLAPWFSLATGTLATLLPSSPGYVGTFDYFAMLGLTAYGASRTVAAAFALLVHIILWLPVTLAGAFLYFAAPLKLAYASRVEPRATETT